MPEPGQDPPKGRGREKGKPAPRRNVFTDATGKKFEVRELPPFWER